jgi:hypothetical protein
MKRSDLGKINEEHIVLAIDISNTGKLKDKRKPNYNNAEF